MGIVTLLWRKLRRDGAAGLVRAARHRRQRRAYNKETLRQRRIRLVRDLSASFNHTIRYGPFAGTRLPLISWSETCMGGKLLGLYEAEVVAELCRRPAGYDVLVNLGAAEGYYGVGALVGKLFASSHCFEASEDGRAALVRHAQLNGVAEQVFVYGSAGARFWNDLGPIGLGKAVVLIDIEGGEFDLLDREALRHLSRSVVIVELHERLVEDGEAKLAKLLAEASEYFRVGEFTTGARDLSGFPELAQMNDTDRWLLCSESRPYLMRWLRLDPL